MDDLVYRKDILATVKTYKMGDGTDRLMASKDDLLGVPSVEDKDNEQHTNYDVLTQNVFNLGDFLEMLVSDALQANGCSCRLKMPNKDFNKCLDWYEWLNLPAPDGDVELHRGTISWDRKSWL